jgi:cytochrome c-type biogenesis protein CcmH/NrfG
LTPAASSAASILRPDEKSTPPKPVTADEVQSLIEEATFDYTMGEHDAALAKLAQATAAAPEAFEAWHALAEINFSLRRFDDALAAGDRAHALRPGDLFINTTLSRIWMEKGDKSRAEHFGAQAKILSWKDQLKNPESTKGL